MEGLYATVVSLYTILDEIGPQLYQKAAIVQNFNDLPKQKPNIEPCLILQAYLAAS